MSRPLVFEWHKRFRGDGEEVDDLRPFDRVFDFKGVIMT